MTTLSAQTQQGLTQFRDRGVERSIQAQRRSLRLPVSNAPASQAFGVGTGNTSGQYTSRQADHVQARPLTSGFAPVRAALKLQSFWGLSDADMLSICGLAAPTQDDSPAALETVLGGMMTVPFVKARLRSLMVIRTRLSALLAGDAAAEKRWLTTPWNRLGGRAPLEVMTSTDMSGLTTVEAELREFTGT